MTADAITTFLEMRARPTLTVTRPNRAGMLLKLDPPTPSFYRYMYVTVGGPWGWVERTELDDEELLAIVADPGVDVFVLYFGGVPAGLFELDRRVAGEIELRHFGLAPDFTGRGLAKPLLAAAVDAAWDHEPERVWVRSSSEDHPRGLLIYQWAGFEPYETSRS